MFCKVFIIAYGVGYTFSMPLAIVLNIWIPHFDVKWVTTVNYSTKMTPAGTSHFCTKTIVSQKLFVVNVFCKVFIVA